MDKRFAALQPEMDKRFEQVDKRFEEMNQPFEQMMNFLWILTGIFTTLTGEVIAFAF